MENYHTEDKGGMGNVLYNYCGGCCAKYVDAWERILFYDCREGCVHVNRSHERTLRE